MFLPVESNIEGNKIFIENKIKFEETKKEKTLKASTTIFEKEIGRHSHDRDPLIELWITVVWDHTKW